LRMSFLLFVVWDTQSMVDHGGQQTQKSVIDWSNPDA
jgi:hypothetical protein